MKKINGLTKTQWIAELKLWDIRHLHSSECNNIYMTAYIDKNDEITSDWGFEAYSYLACITLRGNQYQTKKCMIEKVKEMFIYDE